MALIRYVGLAGELREGATLGACPAEGAVFGVRPGQSLFIGRGAGSDVVIESNRVARAHVTVALMPGAGDRLVVTDLESTNKTTIAGELKTTGVLSPGQELVIAGLFRFRFEDGDAPAVVGPPGALVSSNRKTIGVVLLVLGMLIAGVASWTKIWFRDADGNADIGLHTMRACNEERCRTFDLSAYSSVNHGEQADRSSVFSMMVTTVAVFHLLATAAAVWALVQLLRRRRPTALWLMVPMMVLCLLAGIVLVRMPPVYAHVSADDPFEYYDVVLAGSRFGHWIQWLGFALATAAAVLLLKRQRAGNEAAAGDVPGA